MSIEGFLLLAGLGAVLTVDATAWGQFMMSRPIVAGTLAGWILGAPTEGFLLGILLELYLLVAFPVGGARFPEGAPATVVAVSALHVASPQDGGGAIALGTAAGLIWGQLSGYTAIWVRKWNGRRVPGPVGDAATLARIHLIGILVEALRGALVTGIGVGLVVVAAPSVSASWPLDFAGTYTALLLGGLVSVGILFRSFGRARERVGHFALGVILGAIATVAL